MKPGDKVWIFNGEGIECFILDALFEDAMLIGHQDDGTNVRLVLPHPYFPSREALCEHYRKIFE